MHLTRRHQTATRIERHGVEGGQPWRRQRHAKNHYEERAANGNALIPELQAPQTLAPGAAWWQHSLAGLERLEALALQSNHCGESSDRRGHRSDLPRD